ncbi:DNA repair protein RecN [Zwartia sp.]|uniref:DNA repair protein RecN n=1 Tax=Zwartia sp. TaxID=2978004 RepID=UPI003BB11191
MLRALHIRDFVIVTEAEINFESGFTVFSGETGAGKSILIDALALTLGERADSSVLRSGAARAEISAVFDVPPELSLWLTEHDLSGEGELVLRRVVDAQGRSRAYINGSAVTIAQLREVGEYLVDIHGQHAHQSLLRTESQRDMVDAHGGHQALRQQVSLAWKALRKIERQLTLSEQDANALNAAREKLEWQLGELDRLSLGATEWEEVSAEQTRLANAQSLLDGAALALGCLDENEDSAHHQIVAALQKITQLLRHDPALQAVHESLESARISVSEAVSDLNAYLSRVELDPERLAIVDERMRNIFDLARKFKTEPEQLYTLHAALRSEQEALSASADIETLRATAAALKAEYQTHARALTTARRKAAIDLSKQVSKAMQTLAMEGGQFSVALAEGPASAQGQDVVEFLVAGHAGTTPKPLAKVASGGELARISLALSVIASRAARVPTLIFDEVDSGIGGAVAEVVGNLLRELGLRHQVLCVTHLPQVAARGQQHFQVSKQQTKGVTESSIAKLDVQARIEEVARMLGGIKITPTTLKHAQELLES